MENDFLFIIWHLAFGILLPLPLFVFRVIAHNVHPSTPTDYFALIAHRFDTCTNLHIILSDR